MRTMQSGKKWRLAKSILILYSEINGAAPHRNLSSDGMIGDSNHERTESDHNPWAFDLVTNRGVVTALDITHDPLNGCDCNEIANALEKSMDQRLKYAIWNNKILSYGDDKEMQQLMWREYKGASPYTDHIHISVVSDLTISDLTYPWNLMKTE
ncbi:hypothetical protein ACFGVR_14840 [Mucilaginibacter sp. AW1-3]